MESKYLIVIPYITGESQGNELRYCIAGWRQHFKEPYHIALVGDYHKVVETGDDITYIRCPRIKKTRSDQYLCHLDFVNKFTAALHEFPNTNGFIFCCDDYYAVNDFDINDVKSWKYIGESNFSHNSHNHWQRDKAKTADKLREEGYTTLNYTTHLPQWYEWDKLLMLWDKYNMASESYVMEDLYYNIYHKDEPLIQLAKDDNIKLGIYEKNVSAQTIRDALKTKIWINNSVKGWSPMLGQILKEHYRL